MESKMIEKLEAKGFKRWTKGNFDRLYVNAEDLGLECECYSGGNIRYAELDGEKISNSWARELKKAKTFIDVKTGEIHSDSETLKEKVEEIIDQLNEDEEEREKGEGEMLEVLFGDLNDIGVVICAEDGIVCYCDDSVREELEDTPENREEFIQAAKEMLVTWRTDAGMKSDYYNDDYHIISATEYDELDEDDKNDWQPIDWM